MQDEIFEKVNSRPPTFADEYMDETEIYETMRKSKIYRRCREEKVIRDTVIRIRVQNPTNFSRSGVRAPLLHGF